MFAVGASAKSNSITIDVPAGGSVTVDELTYEDPSTQTFRVALLPADAVAPAVDPALGLEIVYGAAPMETEFCPAATLHAPNTLGWAAGAAVELFIHGLEVGQEWAPYGGWAKVSDATVSADGDRDSGRAGDPAATARSASGWKKVMFPGVQIGSRRSGGNVAAVTSGGGGRPREGRGDLERGGATSRGRGTSGNRG